MCIAYGRIVKKKTFRLNLYNLRVADAALTPSPPVLGS